MTDGQTNRMTDNTLNRQNDNGMDSGNNRQDRQTDRQIE